MGTVLPWRTKHAYPYGWVLEATIRVASLSIHCLLSPDSDPLGAENNREEEVTSRVTLRGRAGGGGRLPVAVLPPRTSVQIH